MPDKKSILIVDDEINVARTLQMVFEMDGYKVTSANSAKEALQKFKDGLSVDIVVTDLNMEAEDIGLNVARAAQKLKPRPLIVICTGYATVFNSSAALDMRVDYLATKPVDLDELKSALVLMLSRRRRPAEKARKENTRKKMKVTTNG